MKVIEAKNIHKSFGKLEVLKGINLTVNKGEVVSILGQSGSGKSTFLRSLINLESIDNGSITICGTPVVITGEYQINEETTAAYRKLGMVFQNFNLFPHKTVLQNIVMSQRIVNKTEKSVATDKAMALLGKVNLIDKKDYYPCQLSGGQQQRVAIARALAMNPAAVLFDEPTSALDPLLTSDILKVIRELAEQHLTMIIVTHEMEFARNVSDRIIFMANGIICEEGTADIIDHPQTQTFQEFLNK